ncbi:Kae1-associated serine/threonine protein kinase [Candidatus Woesearchaeota archaeon]|nr:Kae1-associated serine/threonine protein kinase [Candidatus Woesearchaeota archaeon]
MKEIARGAESVIYDDKETIIKDRLKKNYRIAELDDELRRQRTKKEASLLQKVKIPHPKLIHSDDKQKIVMEKIKGEKLREVLDQKPELARRVGEIVAELHNQNIIHGDLTTSNMILREKSPVPARGAQPQAQQKLCFCVPKRDFLSQQPSCKSFANAHDVALAEGCGNFSNENENNDIVFIDFGLSFHSEKVEDKAVDIHLFKQALNSKHFKVYDEALKAFMFGYKKVNKHEQIMQRLKEVELRGRYKH